MASLMEPCYVCLNGVDIVNSARAAAYAKSSGGSSCMGSCGGVWPTHLCNPDGVTYTSAQADDSSGFDSVWWLDPAQPGSEDIIGVTGIELSVTSGWSSGVGTSSWGGWAGSVRHGPLTVQLSGIIHTRSLRGHAAALAMLIPALSGSLCRARCVPPSLRFWRACSCNGGLTLERLIKGLVLIEPPEIDNEFPRECGVKFVANFKSTVPYIYWPDVDWLVKDEGLFGANCSFYCDVCPEVSDEGCECGCDSTFSLPPRIPNRVGCLCPPTVINRVCVEVPYPALWTDAALVVRVEAGNKELRNLRIRAWPNPLGYSLPTASQNDFRCTKPCVDIEIGCVPTRGSLTVDSTDRTAVITCADGSTRQGLQTLSSGGRGFIWPEIAGCSNLVVCVDSDALWTDPLANVSIGYQRREEL